MPRAAREEQMLVAATRIFARRGYQDASMDEIAAACGVTKPMVYAYFGSKEGLFLACTEREASRLRTTVRAAVKATASPELRLWRGFVAVFEFVERNRESWAVLYPYGPTGASAFAAAAAHARDTMTALLTELFVDTAVGAGVDPQVGAQESEPLAHAMTGATIALASWSIGRPDEPAELHAMRLMNFAWMGLGNLIRGELWIPPIDQEEEGT
jgi:AcrR family transcriptional regulator